MVFDLNETGLHAVNLLIPRYQSLIVFKFVSRNGEKKNQYEPKVINFMSNLCLFWAHLFHFKETKEKDEKTTNSKRKKKCHKYSFIGHNVHT